MHNLLRIGTTGTATPFLSEADLPDSAKNRGGANDEMDDGELASALAKSAQEFSAAGSDCAEISLVMEWF